MRAKGSCPSPLSRSLALNLYSGGRKRNTFAYRQIAFDGCISDYVCGNAQSMHRDKWKTHAEPIDMANASDEQGIEWGGGVGGRRWTESLENALVGHVVLLECPLLQSTHNIDCRRQILWYPLPDSLTAVVYDRITEASMQEVAYTVTLCTEFQRHSKKKRPWKQQG